MNKGNATIAVMAAFSKNFWCKLLWRPVSAESFTNSIKANDQTPSCPGN